MATILCIETSTKVCSVGLSIDGGIVKLKEDSSNKYTHAENLNQFIQDVIDPEGFDKLDAVAVSEGPGSYTGLRIGVSTAKGICFGAGIPLIAVNPLESLLSRVATSSGSLYIPMIDARRLEVFCAGFESDASKVFPTRAQVIDAESFKEFSDYKKVFFFGDGAAKCIDILNEDQFEFIDLEISAAGMGQLAESKYAKSEFQDVAYFEPFYLKDFIAGKPKKKGA